jgi:hypothetical protein
MICDIPMLLVKPAVATTPESSRTNGLMASNNKRGRTSPHSPALTFRICHLLVPMVRPLS